MPEDKVHHYDPNRVYEIPLKEIYVDSDFNSRGVIDPTTIIELAANIRERGLDTPVLIQPWAIQSRPEIKFRLVAGFRRTMAHKMNKAETIRALIREGLTDVDARILNLTENLHRQDLNPLQEANAIKHLVNYDISQPEISRRIGKSRGWVQERVYLLEMPEAIQQDVAAGLVTLKHIRHAYKLHSTEEQIEYIKGVKEAKLRGNVREVKPEKYARKNFKKLRSKEELFDMQDLLIETLGHSLATRVIAWATAEISDLEMHKSIAQEAQKMGRYYAMPEGIEGTHAVTVTSGIEDL